MASTRLCLVTLIVVAPTFPALEAVVARQLNETPLTSIQSPDGDIIDCVHINKQPAFDHPLLKNHTIQMRPHYHPGGLYDVSNNVTNSLTQPWHQNGKCPVHTIPIRRTKQEDILMATSLKKYAKKMARIDPSSISVEDPDDAKKSSATSLGGEKYYGTQAAFNVWQPTLETTNDFSLAQLWIINGSGNDVNTIEVGWEVFPYLYKDSNTRLFIFWTHDGYKTGCYNLDPGCSGFVQTNNQIAIGGSILPVSPISTYSGAEYDFTILVWKDPKGGNWWLQVGNYVLGYWPSSIFTSLADSASNVQWGGEVYSPNDGQTSTQMGSGHFPEEGFGKASYIKNILVVNSSNTLRSLNDVALEAEKPNCYRALKGTASNWGTSIFFGGSGKNNPNC